MPHNKINCQYYCDDGMCFYNNGNYAIYEKCYAIKLDYKLRKYFIEKCKNKELIERIKKILRKPLRMIVLKLLITNFKNKLIL